jgi:hypothetical protein|tara:strand:- start:8485 stop:8892 length:408 start_codon:yes stop_codon:yes gene_type:complete
MRSKKSKKPSRSKLVKLADKVFSEFIRRRNANELGITECFTCGKVDHWKKLQCGHFQSRKHYNTRWNENNCQVQCAGCNVFRYGEQYKFGLYLDKKFGGKMSEKLMQDARKTIKLSNFEIQEIIDHYKNENLKFN